MSNFDEMISTMKSVDYAEKRQFLQYLAQMTQRAKHAFSEEDRQTLLTYAHEEVDQMLKAIPCAETYREKDLIFECEDFLVGMVIPLTGTPDKLAPDLFMKIKALVELVDKERQIETTLDSIFQQNTISEADINRILYWVRQTEDEYQKSKLFLGLLHYRNDLKKLDSHAKDVLAAYISIELRRLPEVDTEDAWNTLELIADVCVYFANDSIVDGLRALLPLGHNRTNYFAVVTLVSIGLEIPEQIIISLAQDLEHANLLYLTLKAAGKQGLFPAQYANEEYLAKSDLVHWLMYPTELGKAPDEIVYLGKIKQLFKKEVFHVFKFRSDSDTLGEDTKNKWLIGWSSNDGGTFSNFDEFAPFENMETEKALKLIKKKLIGR